MVEEMTAGVSRVTYRNALAARYDHVIDGQYRLRVHSHPGHLLNSLQKKIQMIHCERKADRMKLRGLAGFVHQLIDYSG